VEFDAEELGTEIKFRRYMRDRAPYAPKPPMGLGLAVLHWPSHVKGLQVKWLLKYRDGSQGQWKCLLDRWFARTVDGRGAPFTTVPSSFLSKS
jgi:hypothetical protein